MKLGKTLKFRPDLLSQDSSSSFDAASMVAVIVGKDEMMSKTILQQGFSCEVSRLGDKMVHMMLDLFFFGVFFGIYQMEAKFFRVLRLVGTGFKARAEADGRLLCLKLGYSHEVELPVPPAVRVFCFKPDIICCAGIDKGRTHQFAATVRSIKPPDAYVDKGMRYKEEVLKFKPGKKDRLK